MPSDSILYKKLAEELNGMLAGGRIDKIVMPDKSAVMIFIRAGGANHNLLITAAAQPRCYLSREKLTAAAVPPAFCLHLRKHIGGGIIKSVGTLSYERVLVFDITSFGDLGEPRDKKLYVELMGKYSNIVVTGDGGLISDALKHISADEGRPILPGFIFAPPAPRGLAPDRTDEIRELIKIEENTLMGVVRGIAPVTATEAVARNSDVAAGLLDIINSPIRPTVYYSGGEAKDFSFCEYRSINGERKHFDSISEAMGEYFSSRGAVQQKTDGRTLLMRTVGNITEKHKKKLGGFLQDCENAADYEQYRITGELITSNLYKIKNGDRTVTVDDWYSGQPRTIALDGGSPAKYAEKLFARYQKKKRTLSIVKKQIADTETQIDYLESILQSLESCDDENDLALIESELDAAGLLRTQKKGKKADTSKPRKFIVGGYELLVGKSNIQNDMITKAAKGEDIWLHTQGIHGSHAVLSVKNKQPDIEIIRQAASIAAFFSKAKLSENVPVDYTKIKNVRKPKGSPPGKVEYVNQKTVYVNPAPPENA